MALSEAADAHRHIESGDVTGKIVLVIAPDPELNSDGAPPESMPVQGNP